MIHLQMLSFQHHQKKNSSPKIWFPAPTIFLHHLVDMALTNGSVQMEVTNILRLYGTNQHVTNLTLLYKYVFSFLTFIVKCLRVKHCEDYNVFYVPV